MRRGILAAGFFLCISQLAWFGPALAEPDPGATDLPNAIGPCSASATMVGGFTIDPYVSSGIYEIPLAGSASYSGTVDVPEAERPIAGSVVILTPPLIPDITLTDRWDWNGDATGVSDSGNVDWDLPAILPRGIALTVQGQHADSGAVCEGSVQVKIEGGPWDSPILPVSLGGTALAAAGLGWAARPRGTA